MWLARWRLAIDHMWGYHEHTTDGIRHLEGCTLPFETADSPDQARIPCMHACTHASTHTRTHARTHARTRACTHTHTHGMHGTYVECWTVRFEAVETTDQARTAMGLSIYLRIGPSTCLSTCLSTCPALHQTGPDQLHWADHMHLDMHTDMWYTDMCPAASESYHRRRI